MSRSTRLQLAIGVVLVALFGGAMAWLIKHKKAGKADALPVSTAVAGGPMTPPRFAHLMAVHGGTARPTQDGDTLSVTDALDFEVEVAELCFLYVVSAHGDETVLQWRPEPSEPWDRGAYAPMWNDSAARGMHVGPAGDLTLFLVSAPLPLADIDSWSVAQLRAPKEKCPNCAVTVARFKVVEPAGGGAAP